MINKALRQLREENINIPIFKSFHCDAFGTMQTLGAAFTHEQTGRGFLARAENRNQDLLWLAGIFSG